MFLVLRERLAEIETMGADGSKRVEYFLPKKPDSPLVVWVTPLLYVWHENTDINS